VSRGRDASTLHCCWVSLSSRYHWNGVHSPPPASEGRHPASTLDGMEFAASMVPVLSLTGGRGTGVCGGMFLKLV
jgi:hypothetical protein